MKRPRRPEARINFHRIQESNWDFAGQIWAVDLSSIETKKSPLRRSRDTWKLLPCPIISQSPAAGGNSPVTHLPTNWRMCRGKISLFDPTASRSRLDAVSAPEDVLNVYFYLHFCLAPDFYGPFYSLVPLENRRTIFYFATATRWE